MSQSIIYSGEPGFPVRISSYFLTSLAWNQLTFHLTCCKTSSLIMFNRCSIDSFIDATQLTSRGTLVFKESMTYFWLMSFCFFHWNTGLWQSITVDSETFILCSLDCTCHWTRNHWSLGVLFHLLTGWLIRFCLVNNGTPSSCLIGNCSCLLNRQITYSTIMIPIIINNKLVKNIHRYYTMFAKQQIILQNCFKEIWDSHYILFIFKNYTIC